MTKTASTVTKIGAKPPAKAAGGRVFAVSLKGIPRVTAQTKARLDAAARSQGNKHRDYPELVVE